MEFRTLRREERPAFLDLLDGWELADGWRGRDFFRRYLEGDPGFRDEDVWVAAQGGRLLSCVQVFRRSVRVRGRAVPLGGIGSVYTAPDQRRRGLSETLLGRAADALRAGGTPLSLLFANRIAWYTKLGWTSWPVRRTLLAGPGRAGATPARAFAAERDLAAVRALHARVCEALEGVPLRDEAGWQASLRIAGNPGEDFLVAEAGGVVAAYARATRLQGQRVILEAGALPDATDALADLVVALAGSRAVAPDLGFAPGLAEALAARGVAATVVVDPTLMLRCLDPADLARRLGLAPPAPGESAPDFLRRVLPPERLHAWPADRF